MIAVSAAVAIVWTVLLGTAFAGRGAGRTRAAARVVAVYLALAGLSFAWFGFTRTGALGAFGMLLPGAAALLLSQRAP